MENSPVGHTVPTSSNHYGRPIKACSAHWLLPKWPPMGEHSCTVAQGEKLSKCREEDVYSTLLFLARRVERCLMDDPDFSGSSPKAGIRWRAVQNQPGGLPGETSADWTVISSFAAQMDNNRHLYCYHHKLIFCRLK